MSEAELKELKEVCDEVFEYNQNLKKEILDACFQKRFDKYHLKNMHEYLEQYLKYGHRKIKRIGIIYQYYGN